MNELNIMLVDDEAIDLEWLRRRVSQSGLPLHIAGTANNGFAALRLMEEKEIDIILSDIRMPIMTGTEFARKAKAINPSVQIVFISGHDDFGYAREALQVHAYDYLLKPVDDQELYDMLQSLCSRVEKEREQDRRMTETLSLVHQELLLRFFHNRTPEKVEPIIRDFLAPYLDEGTAVALIEIDDVGWKQPDAGDNEELLGIIEKMEAYMQEYVENKQLGTFMHSYQSRYVILAAESEARFVERLQALVVQIRDHFSHTITIGIGHYARTMEGLHDSFRQAQAALSAKWLLGKNRLIQDGSDGEALKQVDVNQEQIVDKLLQAILDYNLVTIDDCLLALLGNDTTPLHKSEVYNLIVRITSKLHADLQQLNENLYELLQWESHEPEMLFRFETVMDVLSWLRRRFFELSELLYTKRQKQKRKLIEEIIDYINANIENKLTLKEVAAEFNFSPNYLGHLFKEETGVHFSEYMSEARIKHVCKLLMDPTLKIYEIADRCGYKNIIYFNRQFKQSTGMTPGEYRKKFKI